jgi:hypothetical protein
MTKRIKAQVNQGDWIDSLPPIILDRIRLCAAERKVPIEIPLMVSLAAIATCAGPGIEIQSGTQRTTRANLFVLLGVGSGIGKSEVFRDMLGPILAFETSLHKWWEDTPAVKARAGEELFKARISGMRTEIRKLYSGRAMTLFKMLQKAERARGACQRLGRSPCLFADDSTSEALAQLMARSHESIATVSADARYLLKRLGVTDSKEESFYLKAFSGDLALTSRVTRHAVRLCRPCLNALLLTQLDAYGKFIEKSVMNRSGLLPRFLHAELKQLEASVPKVDKRRTSTIRTRYATTLVEVLEAYRFEESPTTVEASPEAGKLIREIEQHCRDAAMTDESIRGEVLRRRAEQTWRVSLCLHLARHGNASALHPLELRDAQTAARIVERFTAIPEI